MHTSFKERWGRIPSIFLCFLRIGPVTFGGGYAMIPLIEKEVVDKRKWLETKEVADVFAVAESIPGAIAINSATFIGYRLAGPLGAIAAMAGVLLPTFLIVLLLSVFFMEVHDHPKIEAAFQGIRAAIVALICYAGYKIGKTAVLDKMTFGVVLVTLGILFLPHIHPALMILSGFLIGPILVAIRTRLGMKTTLEGHQIERKEWGFIMGDGI
ncbi:chromate transporter [Paenibacillus sp. YYML68]|uniref:chromate transporter n=1 Tax=Paenibacillus sp. YYML68 TaxID=2909250 RepID=UPI00249239E7|nr:chromate transporter [Paenibacillus sp. YYML68]